MSLRDQAYEQIKHRIITCVFKPGEYLNESAVSAMLRIGRTPVHQALDRLMLEEMVEVMPRKGVIVKPISLDDVMQIIEARLINECYTVRLAAERVGEADIHALEDILSRAEHSEKVRNIEQMMLLDREFHVALARAAGNAVLADVLRRLHDRSLRFWFVSLNASDHHQVVREQHQAILDAMRDRDADAAERAMREHIVAFRYNLMQYL